MSNSELTITLANNIDIDDDSSFNPFDYGELTDASNIYNLEIYQDYEEPGIYINSNKYTDTDDSNFEVASISYNIIYGDISSILNNSNYEYLEYYRHYNIYNVTNNKLEYSFYRIIKIDFNVNLTLSEGLNELDVLSSQYKELIDVFIYDNSREKIFLPYNINSINSDNDEDATTENVYNTIIYNGKIYYLKNIEVSIHTNLNSVDNNTLTIKNIDNTTSTDFSNVDNITYGNNKEEIIITNLDTQNAITSIENHDSNNKTYYTIGLKTNDDNTITITYNIDGIHINVDNNSVQTVNKTSNFTNLDYNYYNLEDNKTYTIEVNVLGLNENDNIYSTLSTTINNIDEYDDSKILDLNLNTSEIVFKFVKFKSDDSTRDISYEEVNHLDISLNKYIHRDASDIINDICYISSIDSNNINFDNKYIYIINNRNLDSSSNTIEYTYSNDELTITYLTDNTLTIDYSLNLIPELRLEETYSELQTIYYDEGIIINNIYYDISNFIFSIHQDNSSGSFSIANNYITISYDYIYNNIGILTYYVIISDSDTTHTNSIFRRVIFHNTTDNIIGISYYSYTNKDFSTIDISDDYYISDVFKLDYSNGDIDNLNIHYNGISVEPNVIYNNDTNNNLSEFSNNYMNISYINDEKFYLEYTISNNTYTISRDLIIIRDLSYVAISFEQYDFSYSNLNDNNIDFIFSPFDISFDNYDQSDAFIEISNVLFNFTSEDISNDDIIEISSINFSNKYIHDFSSSDSNNISDFSNIIDLFDISNIDNSFILIYTFKNEYTSKTLQRVVTIQNTDYYNATLSNSIISISYNILNASSSDDLSSIILKYISHQRVNRDNFTISCEASDICDSRPFMITTTISYDISISLISKNQKPVNLVNLSNSDINTIKIIINDIAPTISLSDISLNYTISFESLFIELLSGDSSLIESTHDNINSISNDLYTILNNSDNSFSSYINSSSLFLDNEFIDISNIIFNFTPSIDIIYNISNSNFLDLYDNSRNDFSLNIIALASTGMSNELTLNIKLNDLYDPIIDLCGNINIELEYNETYYDSCYGVIIYSDSLKYLKIESYKKDNNNEYILDNSLIQYRNDLSKNTNSDTLDGKDNYILNFTNNSISIYNDLSLDTYNNNYTYKINYIAYNYEDLSGLATRYVIFKEYNIIPQLTISNNLFSDLDVSNIILNANRSYYNDFKYGFELSFNFDVDSKRIIYRKSNNNIFTSISFEYEISYNAYNSSFSNEELLVFNKNIDSSNIGDYFFSYNVIITDNSDNDELLFKLLIFSVVDASDKFHIIPDIGDVSNINNYNYNIKNLDNNLIDYIDINDNLTISLPYITSDFSTNTTDPNIINMDQNNILKLIDNSYNYILPYIMKCDNINLTKCSASQNIQIGISDNQTISYDILTVNVDFSYNIKFNYKLNYNSINIDIDSSYDLFFKENYNIIEDSYIDYSNNNVILEGSYIIYDDSYNDLSGIGSLSFNNELSTNIGKHHLNDNSLTTISYEYINISGSIIKNNEILTSNMLIKVIDDNNSSSSSSNYSNRKFLKKDITFKMDISSSFPIRLYIDGYKKLSKLQDSQYITNTDHETNYYNDLDQIYDSLSAYLNPEYLESKSVNYEDISNYITIDGSYIQCSVCNNKTYYYGNLTLNVKKDFNRLSIAYCDICNTKNEYYYTDYFVYNDYTGEIIDINDTIDYYNSIIIREELDISTINFPLHLCVGKYKFTNIDSSTVLYKNNANTDKYEKCKLLDISQLEFIIDYTTPSPLYYCSNTISGEIYIKNNILIKKNCIALNGNVLTQDTSANILQEFSKNNMIYVTRKIINSNNYNNNHIFGFTIANIKNNFKYNNISNKLFIVNSNSQEYAEASKNYLFNSSYVNNNNTNLLQVYDNSSENGIFEINIDMESLFYNRDIFEKYYYLFYDFSNLLINDNSNLSIFKSNIKYIINEAKSYNDDSSLSYKINNNDYDFFSNTLQNDLIVISGISNNRIFLNIQAYLELELFNDTDNDDLINNIYNYNTKISDTNYDKIEISNILFMKEFLYIIDISN